jgi:hypothetical protein
MEEQQLSGSVSEKIKIKCIIKAIGLITLFVFVMTLVIEFHVRKFTWEYVVQESNKSFIYEDFNKKDISKLDNNIQEFYKSARILYGNSNLEHSLIESYDTSNKNTYGWDSSYSSRLINSMDNTITYIENLGFEVSYSYKEKKTVVESLQMIRYFINNQQLINKVRLKMDLIGNYQGMDNSIDVLLIDGGGPEVFKDYETKLKILKKIFK